MPWWHGPTQRTINLTDPLYQVIKFGILEVLITLLLTEPEKQVVMYFSYHCSCIFATAAVSSVNLDKSLGFQTIHNLWNSSYDLLVLFTEFVGTEFYNCVLRL
jgi:hypothetical protein